MRSGPSSPASYHTLAPPSPKPLTMTATSRDERARLEPALILARALKRRRPGVPLPGPQTMAYNSTARIIGFGGSAGGGKTDLACGKGLTQHRKAMMLRRVGTELTGIEDRLEEQIDNKNVYNGQRLIGHPQRPDGNPLKVESASLPNPGDE